MSNKGGVGTLAIAIWFIVLLVISIELITRHRYVSDGLMLGLAIAAYGWWLTARAPREVAQ
jgi:general stress protein CsbA